MAQTSKSKKSTNPKGGSSNGAGSRNRSSKTSTSVAFRSASPSGQNGSGHLLEKFMYDSLKDIYWAEKHLTKAIPKLRKAATNEELKNALSEHLEVTQVHIERLEHVFELIGKKAQAKKCEAMEGLTKEAESIVEETEEGSATRDVGIIIASQKVEHYEIATYGGLAQLARTMGLEEVADLLTQTLEEEKETDENLTFIAENNINLQAEEEVEED